MSYEGYVQCICAKGHYFTHDAYDAEHCPDCNEQAAWENRVDETNCDSYGEIPYAFLSEKFLVVAAVPKMCDLGCLHEISPDIFRVPTPSETRPLRCCRLGDGSTPLVRLDEWEAAAQRHAEARGSGVVDYTDYESVKTTLKTTGDK